ncbi:MAG: Gldg family protein [Myxococcales bacterium]|nr:Gldg family protein [Myxococcales bacterium]
MAVKESSERKRPLPKKPARPSGPHPADAFNLGATVAIFVSWLCLLIGQRVLDTSEGPSLLFTGLGVVGLLATFGQRLWALSGTRPLPGESGARRTTALLFAALSGVGLLALAIWLATTDWGRGLLGLGRPKLGEPNTLFDVGTAAWVTLLATSLLPTLLGELARRSMAKAEHIESGRVVAAVAAGVALAFAASYASLFTYAASKMDVSADFSFFRVAKPSESTAHMIDSLDEPLKVRLYYPAHSEIRPKVERYFADLRKLTGNLEVETLDRPLVPDRAKEDKVTKDGEVVLQRGDMTKTLDIGDDEKTSANKLRKLDGEFQKVLIKVVRDRRTVYLTVGHGELNESTDPKSLRTVSLMRKLVESQNYSLKNLGLAQGLGSEVPKDADVVLVLGPSEAFSEGEVESLKRYAEGGGKLLLALDPDAKVDLAPLAAIAGIAWRDKLVLNDQILYRMKRDDSDKRILVAKRFSSHASVSTLSKNAARGAAVLIPGAAPLDKLDGAEGFQIDFAVKSVPGSYVDEDGSFSRDGDSEKEGTFNLVAAVSRPVAPADGAKKDDKAPGDPSGEMRAIVIGDGDVFTDPVMDYATTNRLLFLEALRWLGGEESFSGEITETEDIRIVHTKGEDQVYFYTTILGVPSLVLGLGLFYTRRRRSPTPVKSAGKGSKSAKDDQKADEAPKPAAKKARAAKKPAEPTAAKKAAAKPARKVSEPPDEDDGPKPPEDDEPADEDSAEEDES